MAVHKQRLKASGATSTRQKMSGGELPGNATWQGKVETQLHVRGGERGSGLSVCASQFCGWLGAPRQMSSKTLSQKTRQLETEVVAYILAG